MLFVLHIYFLTCLLLDSSIYSFQNRPVPFPGAEVVGGDQTKLGFSFGVRFVL